MPRTPNETTPSQFRFPADVLAKLDWLCANWAQGVKLNRTQVLKGLIEGAYESRGGPAAGEASTPAPADAKPAKPKPGKAKKGGQG